MVELLHQFNAWALMHPHDAEVILWCVFVWFVVK